LLRQEATGRQKIVVPNKKRLRDIWGRSPWTIFLERIVMLHTLDGHSAAGFAERRGFPWRELANSAFDRMRTWRSRWQQRQELLDYIDYDHRAAADMGVVHNDAREWAARPFWQD